MCLNGSPGVLSTASRVLPGNIASETAELADLCSAIAKARVLAMFPDDGWSTPSGVHDEAKRKVHFSA